MKLEFSKKEKEIGQKIFKKFLKGWKKDPYWPLLTMNKLFNLLTKEEKELIRKIFSLRSKDYGVTSPFLGIRPIPKNLIMIKNQKYELKGKIKKISKPQFLSKNIFFFYQNLNQAMKKEIGRSLNIISGYRSPASQTTLFFYHLYLRNWNIKKNLKISSLPSYSEHSFVQKQGIDFLPQRGIVKKKDFYKTKEYKWLLKNASRFGFYLSYPKNNKFGLEFEPWHWHFDKLKIKNLNGKKQRKKFNI